MPGLYLGGSGGAKVSGGGSGFSSSYAPSTATQAAFGPGYSQGTGSTGAALMPNDPFGCALWAAVLAAGLLIWIRQSLPR
jgi:hypothetical protein